MELRGTDEMRAPAATVVLSVDLPQVEPAGCRAGVELAERLLNMVRSRRLPVTWAVPHPGATPSVDLRFQYALESEVALLGDASWVAGAASRTQFARELGERVRSARTAGFRISTLAVRDFELRDHLDLLVKHRISLIRGPATNVARGSDLQPQSLRFGVWYAGASVVMPRSGGWNWGGVARDARRAVRRAIQTGGFLQIIVEAEHLTSEKLLHQFDLFVAHLQRQRDRGVLRLRTLSGLVRRVEPPRRIYARSVLRAA